MKRFYTSALFLVFTFIGQSSFASEMKGAIIDMVKLRNLVQLSDGSSIYVAKTCITDRNDGTALASVPVTIDLASAEGTPKDKRIEIKTLSDKKGCVVWSSILGSSLSQDCYSKINVGISVGGYEVGRKLSLFMNASDKKFTFGFDSRELGLWSNQIKTCK